MPRQGAAADGPIVRSGQIRPFSLEGLPRLPPGAIGGTRALARTRAGLPEEIVVPLKRLGAVSVRAGAVSFVPPVEGAGIGFALEVRGERGRLVVDQALALRLVAAVLGLPAPMALRPLGRAERGTLAAIVVAFLEAVRADASIRIGLEDAGPLAGRDTLAVELHVILPDLAGAARLELPARLLGRPGTPRLLADPRALSPRVIVELARTPLAGAAFASAEAGDTLVFDGVAPAPETAAWPVQILLGATACAGELQPDGNLRRRGPIDRNEREIPMSSEDANITAPVPALPLSEEAGRVLAGVPVEVVAEVGRFTVRGDELVGLLEGGVLALGPRRPAEVLLRVGGRPWAQGELVAVDDALAVRITALVK
jgi:flagellar motor switch/type III secretory pathway protein FliN